MLARPIHDIAAITQHGVSEKVSADTALVREIRTRAGLTPDYQYTEIRELRALEMRQTDDMHQHHYRVGRRPHGTEPAAFDASQLRTEPAEDLAALLNSARAAESGARLVIGGGHKFRPAEPGEVFVNVSLESRPDVVADFRDLSVFPDAVFDRIYLERVPLWDQLQENGAAELSRVMRDGGQLVIGTGMNNIAPATERNANIRALQAAGFGDIAYTVARNNMLDPEEKNSLSDWYEISATKTGTDSSESMQPGSKTVEDTFDESDGLRIDDIP